MFKRDVAFDLYLVKYYLWSQKDEEVQQYKDKFAGNQADRRARDVEAANMAEQLKKTKLSGSIFVLSKCCSHIH